MKNHLASVFTVAIVQLAAAQEAPPLERDVNFFEKMLTAVREGGSTIEAGRRFLEQREFACAPRENEIFLPHHGAANFVLCQREFPSVRLEVALYYDGPKFLRGAMKYVPK